MNRIYYDDPFLYKTIVEVIGTNSDYFVEPIFKKLNSQTSWKISDIEKAFEEIR